MFFQLRKAKAQKSGSSFSAGRATKEFPTKHATARNPVQQAPRPALPDARILEHCRAIARKFHTQLHTQEPIFYEALAVVSRRFKSPQHLQMAKQQIALYEKLVEEIQADNVFLMWYATTHVGDIDMLAKTIEKYRDVPLEQIDETRLWQYISMKESDLVTRWATGTTAPGHGLTSTGCGWLVVEVWEKSIGPLNFVEFINPAGHRVAEETPGYSPIMSKRETTVSAWFTHTRRSITPIESMGVKSLLKKISTGEIRQTPEMMLSNYPIRRSKLKLHFTSKFHEELPAPPSYEDTIRAGKNNNCDACGSSSTSRADAIAAENRDRRARSVLTWNTNKTFNADILRPILQV